MLIALATDHAGYEYKERLREHLAAQGHDVRDFGTFSPEPVDYPDWIRPAALAVARGECASGVVLGGSGNGEAIVANRVPGVRCAVCWNVESARLARQHNDANMISLGQRMMTFDTAVAIVGVWLATPFEGGRHEVRIRKIDSAAVREFVPNPPVDRDAPGAESQCAPCGPSLTPPTGSSTTTPPPLPQ